MGFDRKYLVWALGYAVVGMGVGIYMAASKNHAEYVAHAHILLVGFVVSLVYGLIHRLWLHQPRRTIAQTQFVLHQAATVVLLAGLLLLYGNAASEAVLEPFLGIGAIGVLLAMLLMIFMVIKYAAVTEVAVPGPLPPAA
ncbi:MAG TPA: TonB-dependent receptor [Rhodanobacter sp.]|nr:TonB-dependent receptor [Rhodanobacter sp.]